MKELLVIADKKGNVQSAFLHALELAKNTGATIEFVGFVHAAGVDSSEILSREEKRKLRNSYLESKQKAMQTFLDKVNTHDVVVKIDTVWEKSFEQWVCTRCEQKPFDMVFKSGNRSETFLYTPSDWQLMRHCPEPVMIVGEKPWKEGGVVLAALDLGSKSEDTLYLNAEIFRHAKNMANATKSELHTCYSIVVPKALADLDLINPKAYEVKIKESLEPVIQKLIDEENLDREKLHLLLGKPAREICKIAKKISADVVLLGNKTNRTLRGRLLGNTAENVLNKVAADVVVIK